MVGKKGWERANERPLKDFRRPRGTPQLLGAAGRQAKARAKLSGLEKTISLRVDTARRRRRRRSATKPPGRPPKRVPTPTIGMRVRVLHLGEYEHSTVVGIKRKRRGGVWVSVRFSSGRLFSVSGEDVYVPRK